MPSPTERAATLLGDFERDDASVISVLCDRHPEDAVAFTLVDEDMSTTDVTFGELRARSTRFAAASALATT
jgi:acetyl-CoA synthetase